MVCGGARIRAQAWFEAYMHTAPSISLRPQAMLWYAAMFLVVLVLAATLARNWFQGALLVVAVAWAFTLPYHLSLASTMCLAFFNSAFIVPFAPGPLLVSDAACMLAWSGVPLAIVLRRYPEETGELLRRHAGVFIGIAIYLCVLFVLMRVRGVGFGSLGATEGGGRIYFQQVVYSIIPLLFLLAPMEEKLFLRLVFLHFVLSVTYVFSELTLIYGAGLQSVVLRLLQLPTDALTFDVSTTRYFGFRRIQSLFYTCPKIIFAILMYYSARDVLSPKGWWVLPATAVVLFIGLLSGHRANLIHTGIVLALIFWVQRAFTPRTIAFIVFGLLASIVVVYLVAPMLPGAAQRAVSFLPGLDVRADVARDAAGTWQARMEVSRIGIGMIPQYFWLGRGFTRYPHIIPGSPESVQSVTFAVLQGHFLNGTIGLMVNTGVFGMIGATLFLLSGARLALRVLRRVRQTDFRTVLDRTATVIACLYLVNVVFFFFIEGNADWALRRFGIHVGMLFACWRLLERRDRQPSS